MRLLVVGVPRAAPPRLGPPPDARVSRRGRSAAPPSTRAPRPNLKLSEATQTPNGQQLSPIHPYQFLRICIKFPITLFVL